MFFPVQPYHTIKSPYQLILDACLIQVRAAELSRIIFSTFSNCCHFHQLSDNDTFTSGRHYWIPSQTISSLISYDPVRPNSMFRESFLSVHNTRIVILMLLWKKPAPPDTRPKLRAEYNVLARARSRREGPIQYSGPMKSLDSRFRLGSRIAAVGCIGATTNMLKTRR